MTREQRTIILTLVFWDLTRQKLYHHGEPTGGGGAKEEEEPTDPILDSLLSGKLTATQLADSLLAEMFDGVEQYCVIPERYSGVKLDVVGLDEDLKELKGDEIDGLSKVSEGRIIDPSDKQLQAIAIFRAIADQDPRFCNTNAAIPSFAPTLGLYLEGKPGCGKTHIMTAFAIEMKVKLDAQIEDFRGFLRRIISEKVQAFLKAEETPQIGKKANVIDFDSAPVDSSGQQDLSQLDFQQKEDHGQAVKKALEDLRHFLRINPTRPTALLFVEFDTLFEEYSRAPKEAAAKLLEKVCSADLIFIDDLHPKNDPKRVQLIQHLIERRYHTGKYGTFVTSNLDVGNLVQLNSEKPEREKPEGKSTLETRLGSRASSIFVTINIDDAKDWRENVHKKRMDFLDDVSRNSLVPVLKQIINDSPKIDREAISDANKPAI